MVSAKHKPRRIANEFIKRALERDDTITHMEIQKLVYFAHGWMLGIHGRPLHKESWRAWQYGPVLPSLYRDLKKWRGDAVTSMIPRDGGTQLDDDETDIVNQVYDLYHPLGAIRLSQITHAPESPWAQARPYGERPIIYDNNIKLHFKKAYEEFIAQNGQPSQ